MTLLVALAAGCASVTSAHPATAAKEPGTGHRELHRHGPGVPVSSQLATVPYLE